jgi:hypothetical protein
MKDKKTMFFTKSAFRLIISLFSVMYIYQPAVHAHAATRKGKGLRHYILLSEQASLYTKPHAKAQRFLQTPQAFGKRRALRHLVWRVIKRRGSWLKITRPSRIVQRKIKRGHVASCYPTAEFEGVRISFYIRKQDVAWVLQRRIQIKYRDGTQVLLNPGVAVYPVSKRRTKRHQYFWVHIDGWSFQVKLPWASLSRRVRPITFFFPIHKKGQSLFLQGHAKLRLAGKRMYYIKGKRQQNILLKNWKKKSKRHNFIHVHEKCIRFIAKLLSRGSLKRRVFRPIGMIGMKAKKSYFPRGTRVYWPNGNQVGALAQKYIICTRPEVAHRTQRKKIFRCFVHFLYEGSRTENISERHKHHLIQFCFRKKDFRKGFCPNSSNSSPTSNEKWQSQIKEFDRSFR